MGRICFFISSQTVSYINVNFIKNYVSMVKKIFEWNRKVQWYLLIKWIVFVLLWWWKVKSLSCLTLCDPMDCSLPGSSVHGIFQAGVLQWVAISFSRGSSQLRDPTLVSHIAGRRFNLWAAREALVLLWGKYKFGMLFQQLAEFKLT